MKLISIVHTPDTGRVAYSFVLEEETRTYTASVSDTNGIRSIVCEPDLESLLLKILARRNDAVKVLSKATWDLIDGIDVSLPIAF